MKALYKEQKASNPVHLSLYWNVLRFSFTTIEFSLDISFRVLMQHTAPLEKGKREGITYTELTYKYFISIYFCTYKTRI